MKSKKMRLFSAVVAVMLLAAMMVGCAPKAPPVQTDGGETGSSTNAPTIKDDDTLASAGDVYPITKDKYTLKMMACFDVNVEDPENNLFTKELEEKTNIHIDWNLLPYQGKEEKVNLVLATQEGLPDAFLGCGINGAQEMTYGVQQGVLIDMKPYIEKYAPNIKKMFEYCPLLEKQFTAPDGGIYNLPYLAQANHTQYAQKAWIYKPWLDKLGLEMPDTPEKLREVLIAFRDQDPNGNGKKDEIPFTGSVKGWFAQPLDWLMCGFVYSNQKMRYNIADDGSVYAPFVTDEWREGMKYINALCKDGLLDRQVFVQSNAALKQLVMVEGPNVVGVIPMGSSTNFMQADHERLKDWVPLPPLKQADGSVHTATQPYNTAGKFCITKACKDPAVAVRWIDYFYSQEGTRRSSAGKEGIDWRKAEPGEVGLNGKPATYAELKVGGKLTTHWGSTAPYFSPAYEYEGKAVKKVEPGVFDFNKMLYDYTEKYYKPAAEKNVLMPMYLPEEVNEMLSEPLYNINNLIGESMAKFTIGEWDINDDAKWDEYVNRMKAYGLDDVLEAYTEAYKAQYGK